MPTFAFWQNVHLSLRVSFFFWLKRIEILLVCLDQGQELVLGGAHQLPDLLPVLVHLKGGHSRDAGTGSHLLVFVHVDLQWDRGKR